MTAPADSDRMIEILIVEDSATQAERLRYILERSHYRVLVAGDGVEALALLERRDPALVITDIVMPKLDGFELCQRIKANERTRDIAVILLTALSGAEDVLKGLACGADNFITKPYGDEYLVLSVGQVLANRTLGQGERVRVGAEIFFHGKRRFITANQQQMLTLLISTYEAAVQRNMELNKAQEELSSINEHLEELVEERTAALTAEIAERVRVEENHAKLTTQLLQAQKMEAVGRLAGGVAHDFNNMLTVIMGNAELALGALDSSNPLCADIQEIINAGQRAADLTRQLLAFARKQTIAPKVLDLNDAIAGMLKMLERLIGEDINLAWAPGQDLWKVKMDPTQLDQILANLVVNARDAIAGVGKVTIETDNVEIDESYCQTHAGSVPGRYALLAVSDDGCGMDKETLERIFEPFFTTKPQGQGTGLGLATVYGIVKQNDGYINVYSEPGKGTTFRIYLPGYESKKVATEAPVSAKAPTGAEIVLLVEDEESLLNLSKRQLESLGYTVLAAADPNQALQLAEQYAGVIHLLMTDVVMPDMNGRDLWQRLSALRPEMKCLFMSGYTSDAIAHRGVLEEGIHFLQKPFSRESVATHVREALSSASRRHATA